MPTGVMPPKGGITRPNRNMKKIVTSEWMILETGYLFC